MNKKTYLNIIGIVLIFISYVTYNVNYFMDNDEELKEINVSNKNIEVIKSNSTIEDLIPIEDKYLIGSGFNVFLSKLYLKNNIDNDNLYLYEIATKTLKTFNINNYPKDIPFHPHGMDILRINRNEYLLYIINHSVNFLKEGQERIEVIKINLDEEKNNITSFYIKSIILPENFLFTLNSIAVINQDLFYFTTSKPFGLPSKNKNGYLKNKLYDYLATIFTMINFKRCYVYSYNGIIKKVPNSQSLFNNGIRFDKKRNFLYVIRTIEKDIKIFQINPLKQNEAFLIKTIPTLYAGDNIYYNEITDKINIAFTGKMKDNTLIKNSIYKNNGTIKDVDIYNGFLEFSPSQSYNLTDIISFKNKLYGLSTAIKINKNIYSVSIYTKGLFIITDN